MFKITRKKGFHVTFANGYTVSVQFGAGNYCDHYNADFGKDAELASAGSNTAECAVWANDHSMIAHPSFDNDTVGGRMTPKAVLDLLNWAEAQPGAPA